MLLIDWLKGNVTGDKKEMDKSMSAYLMNANTYIDYEQWDRQDVCM